jgi:hypothetical protein
MNYIGTAINIDEKAGDGRRHALRTNVAALAYLTLIHDKWYRHQDTFGDTHNAALARLVLMGWMHGRLADFTSLSNDLNVSRQQATRRCVSMSQAGWVEYKRKIGRVAVKPTDKLVDWASLEIPKRLRFAVPRWQQIALLIGTSIALAAGPSVAAEVGIAVADEVEAIEEGGRIPIVRPHVML